MLVLLNDVPRVKIIAVKRFRFEHHMVAALRGFPQTELPIFQVV